jgi:hypothetical protein
LYNISPLQAGKYRVVISENSNKHVVGKLAINAAGDYHNFVIGPKKVEVIRSKKDPFLKPKLMRVQQQQRGMDIPVSRHGIHRWEVDSTSGARNAGYGERVPQGR